MHSSDEEAMFDDEGATRVSELAEEPADDERPPSEVSAGPPLDTRTGGC